VRIDVAIAGDLDEPVAERAQTRGRRRWIFFANDP
jgi:hypothetical protein